MTETMQMRTASGKAIDVFPAETRVCSKKHPCLTGVIMHLEYHESGAISTLPYHIQWDNDILARKLLGAFRMWAGDHSIEAIENGEE
jgi:hypothetical protein